MDFILQIHTLVEIVIRRYRVLASYLLGEYNVTISL
jgi:hypothetical protein